MDFLAVGDLVVDAFIRLKDARVHCDVNDQQCEICMRWGDKIPYEFAEVVPAVGNAPNASVAAARLGLSSALRSYVGADQFGAQCLASLSADQVNTDYIEKQAGKKTNYHYVLWFESQRTILIKHEVFDYAVPPALGEAEPPKWFYLSSLGENSLDYNIAWLEQLKKWPQTKLAFQPGTYQMKCGKEALVNVYKRADIFFCNKEEAERILGIEPLQDIKSLLLQMKALGPKV
ncbi:MAG: carbohydrate kinase family protein, partial [Patescibacteria group bacterium]